MRWKALKATCLTLVVLAGVAVSACGGALSGDDGDKDRKKVAALLFSQGFEFMVALKQGIEQEARREGVDVVVLDAQGDSTTQIQQIEDQVAAGADGILIAPNNSEELVPGVERANQADVPVVTVDSIIAGGEVAGAVAFDNVAAGQMAAEHMAELAKSGEVLELEGAQGAYHAVRRGDGFKKGIREVGDLQLISRDAEWTAENALSITADTLTANDDVNGIFSHNDEMVRGIVSALRQVNQDSPIVGVDGTPLALERIRNGTQDATVNQDPFEMGALGVRAMVKAMNGAQVAKERLTTPTLVTRENADDPQLWGNRFKP